MFTVGGVHSLEASSIFSIGMVIDNAYNKCSTINSNLAGEVDERPPDESC